MATSVIPTVAQGIYEFQVPLGRKLFKIVMLFNDRDGFWYMDLSNALTGTLLRAGLKVVSQWDLLRLYQDEDERPLGAIIPVPLGAAGQEARTLKDLGTKVLLTFTDTE